jgi:NIMA (never in mitosis gene a)-related kinase
MGQLIKRCKKQKEFIPEEMAWKILSQMILALFECHKRKEGKILHRDLKPGNVFIDAQNNVKLGDFGLSRIMGDESVFAYTHVGTPYYMSPEQIDEQRYTYKCDIWSAGCVIYEIISLRAPFEATNKIQLAYKIKLGEVERIPA